MRDTSQSFKVEQSDISLPDQGSILPRGNLGDIQSFLFSPARKVRTPCRPGEGVRDIFSQLRSCRNVSVDHKRRAPGGTFGSWRTTDKLVLPDVLSAIITGFLDSDIILSALRCHHCNSSITHTILLTFLVSTLLDKGRYLLPG